MNSLVKPFLPLILILIVSLSSLIAQNGFSGVYVNSQPLTFDQTVKLQQLTGPLNMGYYYVDNYGNFGMSGYQPFINLNSAFEAWKMNQARKGNEGWRVKNQSNKFTYRKSPNSAGVHMWEGKNYHYSNWNTDISFSSDGETHVIMYDGKVLDIP